MKPSELQDHMSGTYFTLRWGMVVIAFAFPVLLLAGGLFTDAGVQGSLSAYYHTGMRDLFVGLLVAIGACLYLYKGFSMSENVALNLAGIFVVGVAMFPTQANCADACTPVTVHRVVAVLFFLCIAYVAILKGPETLSLIQDETARNRYRKVYRSLGGLMIASPFAALSASTILEAPTGEKLAVIIAEWFAVWIFAAYWLFKSRELAATEAEKRALDKELQTTPAAASDAPIKKVFTGQTVQAA